MIPTGNDYMNKFYFPKKTDIITSAKITKERFLSLNGHLDWNGLMLNKEEIFYVGKYIELGGISSISKNMTEQLLKRIRENPIKLEDYCQLDQDAQEKGNRFFQIIGATKGPIEERSYLFKFNEETFGPFNVDNFFSEKFRKETRRDFPAQLSGEVALPFLSMLEGGYQEAYEEIGFRLDTFVIDRDGIQNDGVYVVVPGPELTRSRINGYIERQGQMREVVKGITVEGDLSDQEFIQAHLDAILVISSDEKFLYSQFSHTLVTLNLLFLDPSKYQKSIEMFNGVISSIFERITSVKENKLNMDLWTLKEEAQVLKYIDPCLTLLSATIQHFGKSLFYNSNDILEQISHIIRHPDWIAEFKKRYPALDSMESVHNAFRLLVSQV